MTRRTSEARSTRSAGPAPVERGRRLARVGLYVLTATLLAESLFGSRGVGALLRAREEHVALAASLERLKAENQRLRDTAGLLESDPATIEALARRELTMIAPGETVFIIRDARPAGR